MIFFGQFVIDAKVIPPVLFTLLEPLNFFRRRVIGMMVIALV
jgi:hypothetical protein